jgi:hypothetical protein
MARSYIHGRRLSDLAGEGLEPVEARAPEIVSRGGLRIRRECANFQQEESYGESGCQCVQSS